MAPRRIAIVQGHPDPAPERLCRHLAAAYAEGAGNAGHEVRTIEVTALPIGFLRTQADFEGGVADPAIVQAQETLAWAEHWVIIYPLWLGSMPALLKAFLEQACRPGFAFRYRDKGFPEKLMAGRTAHIVVTMGMPAFAYRWFFFAHSLRALKRNILSFIGVKPARDTIVGGVGGLTTEKVAALAARLAADGAAVR
ncbi:MAG: NAD(P)H-dependent oxidoreductase [Phreatobacter sp.]|nr:NAD(P)H-dependent oxidoreductase [Phreatobacter sp.]